MPSEEYIELCQDTLDALRKFIRGSEPGSQMTTFNSAFTILKQTITEAEKRNLEAEAPQDHISSGNESEPADDSLSPGRAWHQLDQNVKKGRILNVIDDHALTGRQIKEALSDAYAESPFAASGIVGLLNELLLGGELEREKQPRGQNHNIKSKGGYTWLWRRRKPELSPELRSLQQRFEVA